MFNEDPYSRAKNGNTALFAIICVTTLFFIVVMASPRSSFTAALPLSLAGLKNFQLWRPATALLINPGAFNLFLDMLILYMFGTMITPILGASKIVLLYLISGIAGLFLCLLPIAIQSETGIVFGCGGGVFGVIMAGAMIFPNMRLYLLFIPFPVKMRTMAIVYLILHLILVQAFSAYFSLIDVGGVIGAYLFMKIFARDRIEWDLLDFFAPKRKPHTVFDASKYNFTVKASPSGSEEKADLSDADRILDKLARSGINSLTPAEIKVLEAVREKMLRDREKR